MKRIVFAFLTFALGMTTWGARAEAKSSRYLMEVRPSLFVSKTCRDVDGKMTNSLIRG